MSKEIRVLPATEAAPEVIDLALGGAIGAAMSAALQADVVRVALSAYLEGRGIAASYRLEITGARLVPAPPQ